MFLSVFRGRRYKTRSLDEVWCRRNITALNSRRDRASRDTARVTIRKVSFKPTSRRSSHAQQGQVRWRSR